MTGLGFGLLSAIMWLAVLLFARRFAGTRRGLSIAAGFGLFAGVAGLLAANGVLDVFTPIPRVMPLFVFGLIGVAGVVVSSIGRDLSQAPLAILIGAQSFRILVELLIHQAVAEGTAPPQMTWTGYNLDIVTGLTAPIVAWWVGRGAPRIALHVWNIATLAILFAVLGVAIISMPTSFQVMKPDNTWVADFPFIWLPTVLVPIALALHGLTFRNLTREMKTS